MAHNRKTVKSQTGTYTYTWTCPAGVTALLHWIHVKYVASGDAGTRKLQVTVYDDATVPVDLCDIVPGANGPTAGLTYHYVFASGGPYRESAFFENELQVSMVPVHLEPGWTLVIADVSGTDSATDEMLIHFQYSDIA